MTINKKHSLALLLDPEKADLSRLPISDACRPDYIFVGGSTGGDPTDFVRALKAKLSIVHRPSSYFPEIRPSLRPKSMLFYSCLCYRDETLNIL